MSTSATIQAIARARSNAAQRNLHTYSDLSDSCPYSANLVTKYVTGTGKGNNPDAAVAAHYPKLRFVILNSDQTLAAVHSAVEWKPGTNDSELIAALTDTLRDTHKVSLPKNAFNQVSIAVMTQSDAQKLHLTELERNPTDCRNMQHATDGEAGDDVAKVTAADLGYANSVYPDTPIFVVIPTTYPLAPGSKFCLDGHKVTSPIPEDVVDDIHPDLKAWIDSIRTTLLHNSTACNDPNGTIFNPSDVTTFSLDDAEAEEQPDDLPSEILASIGDRITDSLYTSVAPLLPSSRRAQETADEMDAAIAVKLESLSLLDTPPTGTAGPTHGTPDPAANLQEFATMFAQVSATATANAFQAHGSRPTATSAPSGSAKIILKYRAMFAHTETDSNGAEVLSPATLTDNFTAVMKEANKAERVRLFRDDIEAHERHLVDQQGWYSNINFDINIMNDAYCTQIVNFGWISDDPGAISGPLDRALSIFCFLRAKTDDQFWNALVDLQMEARADELHETDTKKHKRKSRQLYVSGHMRTRSDLVTALSNFLLFISYMIENPERSDLFIKVKERLDMYNSSRCRKYIDNHARRLPHLVHSFLNDTQLVINLYINLLANNTNVTSPLAKDATVFAAETTKRCLSNTAVIYARQDALCISNIASLHLLPLESYAWFKSQRIEASEDEGTTSAGSSTDKRDAPPEGATQGRNKKTKPEGTSKKGEQAKLSDEEKTKRRAQGFLKKPTGVKQVKKFTHEFSLATTPRKSMCIGHAYVGKFCGQKTCRAYHVPLDLGKLPKVDRDALCKFVSDYPANVEWAPGQKPTTAGE